MPMEGISKFPPEAQLVYFDAYDKTLNLPELKGTRWAISEAESKAELALLEYRIQLKKEKLQEEVSKVSNHQDKISSTQVALFTNSPCQNGLIERWIEKLYPVMLKSINSCPEFESLVLLDKQKASLSLVIEIAKTLFTVEEEPIEE